MAINPAKLKSLVDQQSAAPSAASMGMGPADPGDGDDDDLDEGEGDDAPLDAVGHGNQLIEEWGEFGKALKEEADMLLDNATDIGAELLLKEVPPDAMKKLEKSVDRMPDEISMGVAKYIAPLSPEDREAVAFALASSLGEASDEKLLLAYLDLAATYAGEEIEVDEDFNVPEDEEDDKDEDPDAEGADAAPADAPPEPPAA